MDGSGSSLNPEKDRPSSSPSRSDEDAGRARTHILIVEDSRADLFLIRESLELAAIDAELHVAPDGEKAIRFFEEADADPKAPCPSMVILDLNLPKKPGREVLQRMRQSPRCSNATVVVVTSSDSQKDREDVATLGASAYFRKPSEYDSFMKLGDLVKRLLAFPPH